VPTFILDEIVFGPVQSRRLGMSLGVNLLPAGSKFCNFDCIYCECGRNNERLTEKIVFPAREEIYVAMERKLAAMQSAGHLPDSITFAGNGEPTLHPDFAGIIDDTVLLRNRYAAQSKISVLTNATMLHRQETVDALKRTDLPMLKLDSAIDVTIELLNQPVGKIVSSRLIQQLRGFGGRCIIQTMFLRGMYRGLAIDNTGHEELLAWEEAIVAIQPSQVMIYTIARDTPTDTLRKVSGDALRNIAAIIEKHGIPVLVSE
jgi:wyosine [tRNA(Phe)-imidazoG37] synthetase (radical SAM superfamily)